MRNVEAAKNPISQAEKKTEAMGKRFSGKLFTCRDGPVKVQEQDRDANTRRVPYY